MTGELRYKVTRRQESLVELLPRVHRRWGCSPKGPGKLAGTMHQTPMVLCIMLRIPSSGACSLHSSGGSCVNHSPPKFEQLSGHEWGRMGSATNRCRLLIQSSYADGFSIEAYSPDGHILTSESSSFPTY